MPEVSVHISEGETKMKNITSEDLAKAIKDSDKNSEKLTVMPIDVGASW